MVSKMNVLYAADCRDRLEIDENKLPIDLFKACEKLDNLTIIKLPFGDNISGMCIKEDNNKYYIAINSKQTKGRQNFTLAHELYHMFYDNNKNSVICTEELGNRSITEKNADEFASFLLIPLRTLLKNWNECGKKSLLEKIIYMEQTYAVSHKAMLYFLENYGLISKEDVEKYENIEIKKSAKKLGYDINLYNITKDYYVSNRHIQKIEKAYDIGKISNGKKEEMLLNAFRPDIVYGI